ncbi:MAG: MBL fold metallo-hydrolase [Acidobacteria bacterium]|nr:MBL fold metallo-hydrolase [Acidobacteriota bacterium]MYJ03039.1 MBL fold metallo-hydrolase [Acidobacteriota bacterium]
MADMSRLPFAVTVVAALVCVAAPAASQEPHRIAADGGDIVITPILHASVQVEHNGTVVHVDPWSAGDLSRAKQADLILVTDDPSHHLDPDAITQLRKPGAPVVLTAAAAERFDGGDVLANGEQGVFAGIPVEAVPAYDMTPGQPWHPKGEANGYVVTLGGQRIFFSGVGECVPEIQALRDIDVAFMPMNLPVDRMRPRPVAECVKTFGPSVVYVYHYDNASAGWFGDRSRQRPDNASQVAATIQALRDALDGEPIEVRDAEWYPR